MKKMLVGLIAAFMLAASLVAVSGGTATAARTCPYSGCVPTDTQVSAKSPKARRLRVKASVSAGNKRVREGRIKIQVKGNGKYRQKIFPAGNVRTTFRIRPGLYLVQAKYIPGNSKYMRSAESTIVQVKSRRRR